MSAYEQVMKVVILAAVAAVMVMAVVAVVIQIGYVIHDACKRRKERETK